MDSKVKCCNCNFVGIDDDLIPFKENGKFGDGYGSYGCPNCHTDAYLSTEDE